MTAGLEIRLEVPKTQGILMTVSASVNSHFWNSAYTHYLRSIRKPAI